MKMKRKLILSLLAMLLPISAWCADGDTFEYTPDGSNVKFYFRILSESEKTIELYRDGSRAAVVNAEYEYGDVGTSISVPSSVDYNSTIYALAKIGDSAFELCQMTTVILPEGVKVIGRGAFENCHMLTTINLPSSLISIESGAFYGCI